MVKSTVVVTLSKGKLGSRLGKINGKDSSDPVTERVEKGTGLLSTAMKKALGVQKMSKPNKQSPVRSISARLGLVSGSVKSSKATLQQASTSEGIFGAERPTFRAVGAVHRPAAAVAQRTDTEDEGKVFIFSIIEFDRYTLIDETLQT